MNKLRRNQLEMYVDIMSVIVERLHNNARLTHIMYKANVNCSTLKELVTYLVSKNLITETQQGNRTTYSVTTEGYELVKKYNEIKKALNIETL